LFQNIKKFLGSLRLTIALICALGTLFLLGLWIPQKGLVEYQAYQNWQAKAFLEFFGLTDIYRSPLVLALWGLFFLNLVFVIWQRLPLVLRRTALPEPLPDPTGQYFPHKAVIAVPGSLGLDTVQRTLQRSGFSCRRTADGCYGIRNRYAPLAFLLFHCSFFLLLLGGVISVTTRFTGVVDLAEGEVFHGEPDRYVGKPEMPRVGGFPATYVEVRKVTPLVEARTPTGLRVVLADEKSRPHMIDINSPYKRGSISYVIKDLGLAPLVIMRDAAGKELDGAFVKLDVLRGKQDGFRMQGYEFKTRFYPDHLLVNGEDTTRSDEFNNPVLTVMAEKDGKSRVERLPYRAGSRLQLDNGSLELQRLSFWVRFTLVSEQGVLLIYAGFLLACSALVWRLAFYRREVAAQLSPDREGTQTLCLAYRSEFYRALAEEELERLASRFTAGFTG
jgi:cytochrome c biogenesis protein ResB